jgi:O-antigen ligase/tetratricopeptide (TPR) repeat protein
MSNYPRQFAKNVLEVLILAAFTITPLFVNVSSALPFEESKVILLRSIAILLLPYLVFLWFTERVSEDKKINNESGRISSLIVPAIIVGYASLISTLFSVSPADSFFGGYLRRQGTYTTFCYLLFFFSVVIIINTKKQIDHLLFAGALSGFSAALWAILQRLGLDPNVGAGIEVRVWSTMGNPIFLSAFLIMTIPLQIYFAGLSWNSLKKQRTPFDNGHLYRIFLGLMLIFLIVTITAVMLSQSRGPFLGLVTATCLFLVVHALRLGHGRAAVLCFTGSGILIFLLGLIYIINTSCYIFSDVPILVRLQSGFSSSSGLFRIYIWEGVLDLLSSNPLRILTGYGSETLSLVIPPHFPSIIHYIENPLGIADRAHNELLDLLVMQGILGLAAYLFFFVTIIRFILRELGLIHSRRHESVFAIWIITGGLLGSFIPYVFSGRASYSALGFGFGLIGGLLCYILSRFGEIQRGELHLGHSHGFLLSLLLAALVGHFVEELFCFGTTSTRLYFWVLSAVTIAAGKCPKAITMPKKNTDCPASLSFSSVAMAAWTCIFVLSTITFDYLWFARINHSFLSVILGLHIFTIIACGLFSLALLRGESIHPPDHLRRFFYYLTITLVLYGLYMLIQKIMETYFARMLFGISQEAILPVIEKTANLITFFGWIAGLAFLISLLLILADWVLNKGQTIMVTALIFTTSLILVLPFIISPNLKIAVADIYTRAGEELIGAKHWELAAFCLKKAASLEPGQAWRHQKVGHVYFARARESLEPDKDALFQESMFQLSKATYLAPLEVSLKNNLARISVTWASGATDEKSRFHRLKVTETFYAEARRADPNNTFLWKESAEIASALGKINEASRLLQQALALHPKDFEAHRNLALLYHITGDDSQALVHAEAALTSATEQEKKDIERQLVQIREKKP